MSLEALVSRISTYLEPEQISQVKRAYYFAKQAHDGQRRASGEPYVTHPLAVASILGNMHMDHQSLMAAMLHDVIEDTPVTKEALKDQFGETVSQLVDGVSKLKQIKFESRAQEQAENFQKMAMAMAKDIRVILVKLADRLHNMRTLGALKPSSKRRIARETLDIYAPIALRLGINTIRLELEELGFCALYPMRSGLIQKAVKRSRGNRKEIVNDISVALKQCLEREGLPGRVQGREKHLNGIYQKMRLQKKSFSEIMDVYAFRIITDKVDTCYRVLGAVHNLYKPVPDRFKDYVAIPKVNGYQSLHTTLFGMHGVPIEIQIRTEDMESMANNGIAAHWLYKFDKDTNDPAHARARQWVQGLLELQKSAGNSLEFIENVKFDLFPDEVYVFTPKGEILELPKGATAVDFAYAVHSDIGNSCVACRINRHLAPLSVPLESGQTIEVITSPSAQPNPAWLSFVVTGKARATIRHYLKNKRRSESIELGQRLLDKSLAHMQMSIANLSSNSKSKIIHDIQADTFEDLLEDIGLGNRMASLVAQHLTGEHIPNIDYTTESLTIPYQAPVQNASPLIIKGTEGMIVTFAKCCNPIPGDVIAGRLSAGRGIVIHRETCNNISDVLDDPEKCVHLRWDKDINTEFQVALNIIVENQRGIIAMIASVVTAADASIEKISVEDRDAKLSIISLILKIQNRAHLARTMRKIRNIKAVYKITRVKD